MARDSEVDSSLALEMGWTREFSAGQEWWTSPYGGEEQSAPPNLTDSGEGLLSVLEWMEENGYSYEVNAMDGQPVVDIYDGDLDHCGKAVARTLPLAVATALLRSVE